MQQFLDICRELWVRDYPELVNIEALSPSDGEIIIGNGSEWLDVSFLSVLNTMPRYVDRGDPAGADWQVGDFTRDGAWHDFDLRGIIPDKTRLVNFNIAMLSTVVGREVSIRQKGNANDINIAVMRNEVAGVWNRGHLVCSPNPSRFCQYKVSTVQVTSINLSVRGWWF